MNHKDHHILKSDNRGLVSIIVTIIIMLIISLIVLGFARLVRREQRQSLDRQLSTQAFYAAETGVNDAVKAIGSITTEKTSCAHDAWESPNLSGNVSYTCVLVDPDPTSLEFSSVDSVNSAIFPVKSANGLAISNLTVSWQDKDGSTGFACPLPSLPANLPAGCTTGILRIDLVPFQGTKNRDDLIDDTFTAFLYPHTSSPGPVSYGASTTGLTGAGRIIAGGCSSTNTPKYCNVVINGLTENNYYVRLISIYKTSAVTLTAQGGAGELAGAQAIIDSTGKATDVLRRIQVRASLTSSGVWPDLPLQLSDGFCKRFGIAPPDIVDPDASGGPMCDPLNEAFN